MNISVITILELFFLGCLVVFLFVCFFFFFKSGPKKVKEKKNGSFFTILSVNMG